MHEPRSLYCLPYLASADRVFITEGEKAVNAAHGSQSPDKTEWSPLAGKDYVILPDHDEPGDKYADAVVAVLTKPTPTSA